MKTTSTWRRTIAVGCLGAMSLSLTGCSVINGACRSLKQQECLDEFMIGYRNQALAAKAWHRVKNCYCDKNYYNDFKAGFFAGYADVAAGGPGCTPAVAPTSYWGWRYQSRDGQAAVNAYFEGYPLGVKAAEQDGVGHWGSVRPNFQRPQQVQPLVAAPIASLSDRDEDARDDNPFFPQPVPDSEPQDEDAEGAMDGEDEDLELGDDPAGAIERALEEALDGSDSVQILEIDGVPLAGEADDLVPQSSASYEIADRRGGASEVSAAITDDSTSFEEIFGAATSEASTGGEPGELPFVFE